MGIGTIKFNNLPGLYPDKIDGNLVPEASSPAPRTVVIGTAEKGQSSPFLMTSTTTAKLQFGTEGTLYKGALEAKKAGAEEVLMLRIGSTPAVLSKVSYGASATAGGYIIETVRKDDSAGTDYSIGYDAAADRMIIARTADGLIVFDNSVVAPVDRFEVIVSGYGSDDVVDTDIGTVFAQDVGSVSLASGATLATETFEIAIDGGSPTLVTLGSSTPATPATTVADINAALATASITAVEAVVSGDFAALKAVDPATTFELSDIGVGGGLALFGFTAAVYSGSVFVSLATAASTAAQEVFVDGVDGVDLSRMEVYEKLHVAYKELMNFSFDVCVPMDVHLDDHNVVDQGHFLGAIPPELATANVYPTAGIYKPGIEVDALGKVFIEEFQGEFFFWWEDPTTPGTAILFPGADKGSKLADASTKMDGSELTAADFHEVNFGYQLARFLFEYSTNIVDATGVIGVLPPGSNSLKDKALWVGKAPTTETNVTTGITTITGNGYGLLGNKFMAGMAGYRVGAIGGGFIATEGEFIDSGIELVDSNEIPVDLGKYINIIGDWPLLRNNFAQAGYVSSWAPSYGGFYSTMNPASAPTNKLTSSATIVYQIGVQDLDLLAGAGYVMLRQKAQGTVVADAPTAALATSDWSRLSTVRIVKTVIDGMREAAEPFLGEAFSSAKKAALETALEQVLVRAKKAGLLKGFKEFSVLQTPDQAVQGKAFVVLTLTPAFELRQIELAVNLSKTG